jgi:hypothetical protein
MHELWRKLTERGPSVLTEETGNLVGNTLGTSENETLVGAVFHDLLKVLDHLVTLLKVRNDLNNLVNAVVGGEFHGTNVDLNVVVQEVRGQLADLLGPSSGPHASLTVRANLSNDLADLGLETHVKHAVSLVKNEVSNTAKVGTASLEHVNKTTRSGNANLNTTREITNLRTLGDTTVDTGVANTRGLAKLGNFGLNLDSQLTSGSQDEDNRAVTRSKERLGVDVHNSGKTVAQSLSGTSLGNTDNITSGEGHGPTLGLNSSGLLEALSLDLREDVLGEASLIESLNGAGDIGTLDGHDLLLAESLDILFRALGNIGVLLVERLLELGERVQV